MTTFPQLLRPVHLAFLLALGAGLPTSQAQNLIDLYQAAQSYDASYQSAKVLYESSVFKAEQSLALSLPTVTLGSTASQNIRNSSVVTPQEVSYMTQNATLSASQPLYRPANTATMAQSKKTLDQARTTLHTAEQDLIVRVSQAYFDVLAAQDTLTFVKAQKTAVSEQLASAKRNFEVGTATITDTREAQARFDLVIAQEIAAENDLRVKKLALDQLVGKSGSQPKPLATVRLPEVQPADPQAWVDQGVSQHPNIRKARLQLDVAKLDTEVAKAGHKPTLDLTASAFVNKNSSGSDLNALDSTLTRQSIGLTFSLPLFAGYATTNRIKETLALEDKARSDLDAAQRTVEQATRAAYFGVVSSMGQVKAFEAAETSSQVALDANKLGYQVGVRINIDVLNSQSQLFQTKRDLAKARYDVLLGNLKLRQANGTLKPDDLQSINALLQP
jgi:outer membrane protein